MIPPDSAIDPQVTSPSGVRYKRTSVSSLVVKIHSQYICRLVFRTPYACSSAVDCNVLIVAARECIIASSTVSVPRPLLGVGTPSVLCCCLGDAWPNLLRVCAGSGGFPSCLRRV